MKPVLTQGQPLPEPLLGRASPQRGRYPARSRSLLREGTIQAAILRYLRLDRRVAWVERFNAGAHLSEETRPNGKTRRRMIRFAFPGCSDLLGQLRDGRFLAVEVKTPRGRISPAQRAFLERVNANGGVGLVARSLDELIPQLDAVHPADAGRCGGNPSDPAFQLEMTT